MQAPVIQQLMAPMPAHDNTTVGVESFALNTVGLAVGEATESGDAGSEKQAIGAFAELLKKQTAKKDISPEPSVSDTTLPALNSNASYNTPLATELLMAAKLGNGNVGNTLVQNPVGTEFSLDTMRSELSATEQQLKSETSRFVTTPNTPVAPLQTRAAQPVSSDQQHMPPMAMVAEQVHVDTPKSQNDNPLKSAVQSAPFVSNATAAESLSPVQTPAPTVESLQGQQPVQLKAQLDNKQVIPDSSVVLTAAEEGIDGSGPHDISLWRSGNGISF